MSKLCAPSERLAVILTDVLRWRGAEWGPTPSSGGSRRGSTGLSLQGSAAHMTR